ncbi:hypothetical protein D3C81_872530 [compost metagenome]
MLLVEQINRRVRHRFTDVQRRANVDTPGSRDHGGLGRAVVVDHGEALLTAELAQAIATDQQGAQGRMIEVLTERIFGDRCWQKAHVQRLRTPPVEQPIDVFSAIMGWGQVQGRARAQGRPDFPRHRIETESGKA